MKWFKHISDSLDDPFINELLDDFGSDAYIVFFGIIEVYSREFSPQLSWKLDVKVKHLCRKTRTSVAKLKKILSKIHKWEIEYIDDRVYILIPKFTQLLDNYTRNTNPHKQETLASDLQETFQPIRSKNKEERIKKEHIGEKRAVLQRAREGHRSPSMDGSLPKQRLVSRQKQNEGLESVHKDMGEKSS